MENMAMTPADVVSIARGTESNGLLGGGGAIWVVLLFLILFGRNDFGGNNGNAATAATQQEILYGQQFQAIRDKQDGIGDGMCQGFYALNNSLMGEGRALQTQLANYHCDTRLGIANLGANIDKQTCEITSAVHAEGEATRALITQNEMQALRYNNFQLQLKASQCDQNAYLINRLQPCPVPAYQVANPYCCYPPQASF